MLPKVVIYDSVSVDGAIKDFDVNIPLHYMIAGRFGADAMLVGSVTSKTGIEMFMQTVPAEEPSDFVKPKIEPNDQRPIWVIADSKGVMKGLMHVNRRSEYTKDVIVLVSNSTPKAYLDYLKERNYDTIQTGEDHADLRIALEELNRQYGIKTVVTDTGGVLASVLLEQGLADELQLLITTEIIGKNAVNLFRSLNKVVKLELLNCEVLDKAHALLGLKVLKEKQ
ncbi:MAG: dihydrofolate reductase family protein [Candidatus Bathyarchaeia archaeon]|jgi:2,5-diamino-6-(ribosylamino)-4(3H)-pyrimidinone 5'-phosphate reductase